MKIEIGNWKVRVIIIRMMSKSIRWNNKNKQFTRVRGFASRIRNIDRNEVPRILQVVESRYDFSDSSALFSEQTIKLSFITRQILNHRYCRRLPGVARNTRAIPKTKRPKNCIIQMFMCDLVLSKTNLSYLETNFQTHQNQNVKYYFHDGSLEIYF